jgi:kanamycin kinase
MVEDFNGTAWTVQPAPSLGGNSLLGSPAWWPPTREPCGRPAHQDLSTAEALRLAADIPPIDRLVVCHADACAPNTLITPDGHWSGHVDLGLLGAADRWADIAVATWSAEWNYGPGWEPAMLGAYGIEPDPGRTRYYRLLFDLSS